MKYLELRLASQLEPRGRSGVSEMKVSCVLWRQQQMSMRELAGAHHGRDVGAGN